MYHKIRPVASAWAIALLLIGTAQASTIPSLAVLDFERTSDVSESQASVLADQIRMELMNTGEYSVIERGQLNMIFQEQSIQASGICNSNECAVQIGQMVGADQIITGSVGRFGSIWVLNLRRIDVETGKVLKMGQTKVKDPIENLLEKGVPEAVARIQDGSASTSVEISSDPTPCSDKDLCASITLSTPFATIAEGIVGARFALSWHNVSVFTGYGLYGVYSQMFENGVTFFDRKGSRIYPAIGISYKFGIHELALVQDYLSFAEYDYGEYNYSDEGYNRNLLLQYQADVGQEGGWGVLIGAGISYITYSYFTYDYDWTTGTETRLTASLALTYQVMDKTPIFERKATTTEE